MWDRAPRKIFLTGIIAGAILFALTIGNAALLTGDLQTAWGDWTNMFASILGGIGPLYAAKRNPGSPQLRKSWRLIGFANLAWAIGSAAWLVLEVYFKIAPFPSLADAFYLSYYGLFIAALLALPRAQASPWNRKKLLLEMSIATVAVVVVFGSLIVMPLASSKSEDGLVTTILTLTYPAGDLALLWAVASLSLIRNPFRDFPALLLLVAGLLLMVLADLLFSYLSLTGSYSCGQWTDVIFAAAALLTGIAGFRAGYAGEEIDSAASSRVSSTAFEGVTHPPIDWRRQLPNVASTLVLLAIAWIPGRNLSPHLSFLLIGSGILTALVFVRQLIALKENSDLNGTLRSTWAGLQERTAELQRANERLQLEIEERQRIEAEQSAMESKMQQMQKLESLGVLAGGIAHDFNNLLTGIMGNTSLIQQIRKSDTEIQPFLEDLNTAATQAAALTNQMLAYSGKGAFALSRIDLNRLAAEMESLVHASISKKVELQLELASGLPAVFGDPNQLTQVIMNLITNASEAIEPRPGVIKVRTGRMDVGPEFFAQASLPDPLPSGQYVFLEVSDNGHGIDPVTLARIFEPFFTTKFTGRGLGLSATLGIIRGHKGNIRVESEPGVGSRFTLVLPAAVEEPATQKEALLSNRPATRASRTVLIVDDEALVRNVAVRVLRQRGFDVLEATQGQEAVELVRQHPNGIDIILLDLMMPVMGGEEAFEKIRLLAPDVPVVLASGFSEKAVASRFLAESPDGFLQKPFMADALILALENVMARGALDGDTAPSELEPATLL